jgi:protein SCO1
MRWDERRSGVSRRDAVSASLRPILAAALITLAACGSSADRGSGATTLASSPTVSTSAGPVALTGVVREPAPVVNGTALPSLTDPGVDVGFTASPGHIKVVYFGFTNCPDVCPTTLADLTVALRKLDDASGRAGRVETLMVTVDPGRDLDLLPDYVTSFVSTAVAAGTGDAAALAAAAEPFGVTYDVRTLGDGTVEVDHSPFLYAVDDAGELVVSWQFGASSDDIAADLGILLDRYR